MGGAGDAPDVANRAGGESRHTVPRSSDGVTPTGFAKVSSGPLNEMLYEPTGTATSRRTTLPSRRCTRTDPSLPLAT